jgi:hypothetical protein
MTAFVEIKGARVAFGMIWKRVEAKGAKAEVAALVRRHRAAYLIHWREHVGIAQQPRKGAGESKRKEAPLSGAALFASCMAEQARNAVLVLPLDERHTRYAFVAVVDGAPYLDLVIGSTNVRERMFSLKQEGHGSYAEFGSHPDFPAAKPFKAEELLGKDAQQALMSKAVIRQSRQAVIVRAVIAATAIAASYAWYYMDLEKEQEAAAQEVQVDPVAEYKKATQAVLASPAPLGSDAFETIWTPLANRDTSVKGFEAEKVICNRSGCAEQWKRNGGSNDLFMAQFPAGTRFDFGMTGAVSLDKATMLRDHKTKVVPITFASLPQREKFWVQLTSEAQKRKFEPELYGGLQVVSYALTAPKTLERVAGVPKALHLYTGTFEIKGPYSLMKEALMTLHPNMRVDEVTLDVSGGEKGANFMVKGKFYVKD